LWCTPRTFILIVLVAIALKIIFLSKKRYYAAGKTATDPSKLTTLIGVI